MPSTSAAASAALFIVPIMESPWASRPVKPTWYLFRRLYAGGLDDPAHQVGLAPDLRGELLGRVSEHVEADVGDPGPGLGLVHGANRVGGDATRERGLHAA